MRALREGLDFSIVRADLQAAEDLLRSLRAKLAEIEAAGEAPGQGGDQPVSIDL